ncbi:MAG: hypothetical protein NZL85_01110 [Fimbriimonadales bacterium]|nr:hypothetical protein [Fimbriimonadales bacterium]
MRSAIAIGWLTVALLGFLSGSLLNLNPADSLARVGMALYALLLVISLSAVVLNRLRESK